MIGLPGRNARLLAAALLACGAAANGAAADAEEKWLKASTDDEIQAITPDEVSHKNPRGEAVKRVQYLRDLAAWLQAGKPSSGKPAFVQPEPKKKKPK
jgi:hypothetical protein